MGRLDGKRAVITGGAGGIGVAAAKLFVAEGARVLLVDHDQAALQRAAQDIGTASCVADVSDAAASKAYVAQAVRELGGIDVALLNAGIEGPVKPIAEMPVEAFDHVMAVNVRGVFLGLKEVMPRMKAIGGGSIVITASVASLRGGPGASPYITSKHAAIGLMRTAALEGAPDKIRVNSVNPAPIATRMMDSIEKQRNPDDPQKVRRAWLERIPARRYGTPEEVAKLMLFLASDDSGFCSGGTYLIDGAMMA
jgi:NAD(P)-dependent dehydrogenase (short-subunit alcohol dehydrogenase family)